MKRFLLALPYTLELAFWRGAGKLQLLAAIFCLLSLVYVYFKWLAAACFAGFLTNIIYLEFKDWRKRDILEGLDGWVYSRKEKRWFRN